MHRKNLHSTRFRPAQRGATLLFVILAITIMSLMGVAVLNLSSTSSKQELTANTHDRAQFLAEAGYNYFASRLIELIALGKDRDEICNDITGTYDLSPWGSFTLTVTDPLGDQAEIDFNEAKAAGATDELMVISEDYKVVSVGHVSGDGVDSEGYAQMEMLAGKEFFRISYFEEGFEDLDDWVDPTTNSIPSDTVIQSYYSTNGSHLYYARLDKVSATTVTNSVTGDTEEYTSYEFCLDKEDAFEEAWTKNDNLLSYEVQVKLGAGYQLQFMAWGISFREHTTASTNVQETYGLSVIKYYTDDGSAYPDFEDGIPDGLKPAGMGTEVQDWRTVTFRYGGRWYTLPDEPQLSTTTNRVLIVLWKRTYDADRSDHYNYEWVAYKQLYLNNNNATYTYDRESAVWPQWNHDTQSVTDNTTLMVRVVERPAGYYTNAALVDYYGNNLKAYTDLGKHNEITVFYADPSITPTSNRDGGYYSQDISIWKDNSIPESRAASYSLGRREAYPSSWVIAEKEATPSPSDDIEIGFPGWPSIFPHKWLPDVDYFTAVGGDTPYRGHGAEADKPSMLTWDSVRYEAGVRTLLELAEGGTVILDNSFVTASAGQDFVTANDTSKRHEICLHGFAEPHLDGYSSEANQSLAYDDFAVSLLFFVPEYEVDKTN